tara:strand:+ start:981 stop:4862 length:3882 start_codon:yes stop_codon:yes gene_type:complete
MAKKIQGATLTFKVSDDGTLKLLGKQAQKTGAALKNTGKNAGDVRRNMQAMSGRVESGTKGFARMQQGTGGLVQSYAILASTLFAVGAAFRALQNAANIENQIKGFRSLAAITGESMMGVTAAVRAATGGLLNFQDAAQQAAIATAAGFTQEQIAGLAEGAKIASVTLGRDLTDSFNRLIRGVTKAEPELLDELGIILRLDIATRKFANANGLIAEKLTISQRRAAVFEEVQRQLIANFGAMESEADKLLNPFDRLMTKISDFAIAVQGPIVRVFGGMADFLSENFGALVTVVSMFAMSILKQIVPSFQQMGASAVAAGDLAKKRIRDLNKDIRTQKKAIKDVEREFKVSEVRKNKIFTAELKRRGISLKKFTAMSLKEQRKLVMQIMADEKKGLAHTQKFNKQRYASYKAVSERIKRESKRTSFTLIAHAKVAGAQITMALTKPLIKVQGAIAGIGVAAARLAPIFAFLGAVVNAAFGLLMAFFTAKFIVDLLPITKRINESFQAINETTGVLEETVTDLAHTIASDLDDKRIVKIKEEFEGVEGATLAANYQIERLNKLLNRGQSGASFLEDLQKSITQNFGEGQETSFIGNFLNFSDTAAGSKGFESKAYQAQVKNVVLELQAMAMKQFESLKTMDSKNTGFELGMFEAIFATAGDLEGFQAFKTEFEEIMAMGDNASRSTALERLLVDSASSLSDTYEEGIGFIEITKKGNLIITDATKNLLHLGDVGTESFQRITSIIPNTKEAAKSLKETLQNMMPKPSQAESAVAAIRTLKEQFVGEDGAIKQFQLTEDKMESIVKTMEQQLGISFEVTGSFQEQAEAVKKILESEEARLDLADTLIDTAGIFNSALKTQQNMIGFLNTSYSKRAKIELKIAQLREQQVQNIAKNEIKNSEKLIDLNGEIEENRQRAILGVQTMNRELESQIDLLAASLHMVESLGKSLLETFDKSAISNLTKLIDTGNLGEFGGKELVNSLTKDLKKASAGVISETLISPITEALTPKAYKLNKKLNPAQQIAAAHKQHIDGLASVLQQHINAMPGAKGTISNDQTLTDPTTMTIGDLYGSGETAGGFTEGFRSFFGKGGTLLSGLFGKTGKQRMGDVSVGEDGIEEVTTIAGKNQAGVLGTYGGTDLFGIRKTFENTFGDGGTFEESGGKIFGKGGMFQSIAGDVFGTLFGEGGMGSSLLSMFGFRDGGYTPSLAGGGVVKGPSTGYSATLHGNEAVVPLPDGNKIPVELGKKSNTNNTNITVNMAEGSSTTTSDNGAELAQAIDIAVQNTIEKELRPGGILAG